MFKSGTFAQGHYAAGFFDNSLGGAPVGPTLNLVFRQRSPAPQQRYKTSKPQGIYLSN